jgi:hypothetical protein
MRQPWQDLPCGCHWEMYYGWQYCTVGSALSFASFIADDLFKRVQERGGKTIEEMRPFEETRNVTRDAFFAHMGWR